MLVHQKWLWCRAAHAEAETKSLQRQLKEMGARMASSTKELGVLNELNRGLMDNQAVYKEKLAAEEATHKEKDSTISVRNCTPTEPATVTERALDVQADVGFILQLGSPPLYRAHHLH